MSASGSACDRNPWRWTALGGRRTNPPVRPSFEARPPEVQRPTSAKAELRGGGAGLRPSAVFTQRRTRPGLRGARPQPATKVWDETECRNLPGPAAGHRHHCHCRWSDSGGRPASTTLKPRYACDPRAADVCDTRWAPVDRAERALVECRQRQRQRHCRAGATRERSRPPVRPKSTTPGSPSFPPVVSFGSLVTSPGCV